MDTHQRNLSLILSVLFLLLIGLVITIVVLLFRVDEQQLRDVQTGTTSEERQEERAERREERREERQEERESNSGGFLGDLFGFGSSNDDATFDTGTTTDNGTTTGTTNGGTSSSGGSSGGTTSGGNATSGSGATSGGSTGTTPDSETCRNPNRDGSCGDADLDGDGVPDTTDGTTPDSETCRNPNRDGSCGDADLDGDGVPDTTDGTTDASDGNGNIRWITADNWIGFLADEEASVYSDIGGNQIKDPATSFPIVTIAYQLTRPSELETDEEAYERNKLAILNSYVTYQASRRELIDGMPAETYMVATRTGAEFVYFMKVSRYIVHIHLRPVGGSVDGVEVIQSIDFYPDETYIESARQVGAR